MLRKPHERGQRWYPHKALDNVAESLNALGDNTTAELPWHTLAQEDAAARVPQLRHGLAAVHRFVAMVEAIAEGRGPVTCADCSSQFYPARSGAQYCSAACRQRAYRRRTG
jgi:hypothetical protein